MIDHRRRHAEFGQIGERSEPGLVLADTGIVQDHPARTGLGGKIAGIDTAVRAADQHMAAMGGAKRGDRIGDAYFCHHAGISSRQSGPSGSIGDQSRVQ